MPPMSMLLIRNISKYYSKFRFCFSYQFLVSSSSWATTVPCGLTPTPPWLWFICALTIFGKGQGQGKSMCVWVCCQRSFELRLAKISMETVSNIWLRCCWRLFFCFSVSAVLIKRRRPRSKPFCISWKMLRSYDNSAEELCEPERQVDRGASGGDGGQLLSKSSLFSGFTY